MTRFVNSIVFVRSLFASSKRFSSSVSLPNARITESPVKISLDTRLILSTSFCISLKRGIVTAINTITYPRITRIARIMIHPIPAPVWMIFKTPPIPRIGAYATIRIITAETIWICWISLVLLVIRDAVEKRSISAFEKRTTRPNIFPLRSRPIPAPIRAPTNPTRTVATPISSAIATILPPADQR